MAVLPPLYDANAKMYKTNHDNKEKDLVQQLLSVCFLLSVGTTSDSRQTTQTAQVPQNTLFHAPHFRPGHCGNDLRSQRQPSLGLARVPGSLYLPSPTALLPSSGCDTLRAP